MATYWTIQGSLATLQTPLLAATIDVHFPWRGLNLAASKLDGVALLKVNTRETEHDQPETLVDFYPRGVDLIATYAQTPQRTIRPQVYWRYVQSQEIAGAELILSAQTSLLASDPRLLVESTLPGGECLPLSSAGTPVAQPGEPIYGVLFRPAHWAMSYCEFIFPSDRAEGRLSALGNTNSVQWLLFPDSLEKGVVRRGRVRGVLLPRERDLELAAQAWREFVDSPLVLST